MNRTISRLMLGRRSAIAQLFGGLGLLGTAQTTFRDKDSPRVTVGLRSPKDATVTQIVAGGSTIMAGEIVFVLGSEDETRTNQRIELTKQLLQIEGHLPNPAHVEGRRESLRLTQNAADKYVETAKAFHEKHVTFAMHGVVDPVELARTSAFLARAKGEAEKASLALERFEFDVSQMTARHAALAAKVPKETDFLAAKIKRLEIVSPFNASLDFGQEPVHVNL
jgi:hypothetical protein